MIKKLLPSLLIILILCSSCGFKPKYQGYRGIDFNLNLLSANGDRDLNNKIQSQIRRYRNLDENYKTIQLTLVTEFEKEATARNSKGEVTKYNLKALANFEINFEGTIQKITFLEEFKIDKISNSVEENNYIKIIKDDFADNIIEKLISYIKNENDN